MCLIAFDWHPKANRKLTLISNRDEFYHRPSKTAHYWDDNPTIYGGKDLEMGGTWLAVSTESRFAAVTNYRQADMSKYPLSRGKIPSDFLESSNSAIEWFEQYQHALSDFAGFNAILYDGEDLVYISNRNGSEALLLTQGQYGLSNHLLDTPWPKVVKAKSALLRHLEEPHPAKVNDRLLDEFQNHSIAPDDELPNTGVGIDLERMLSPMFIRSPSYGTRTSTALSIYKNGDIHFTERNYLNSDDMSYSDSYQLIQSGT